MTEARISDDRLILARNLKNLGCFCSFLLQVGIGARIILNSQVVKDDDLWLTHKSKWLLLLLLLMLLLLMLLLLLHRRTDAALKNERLSFYFWREKQKFRRSVPLSFFLFLLPFKLV